jgi:hypothetical protein
MSNPLKPLAVFRPNYNYSICHPILMPANDDEMIAIMTYPCCWPTLPILVLARPWRGGHSDLGISREMAFLFGGDWKDIRRPPTDTFILYRMTMEDMLTTEDFPPQECRLRVRMRAQPPQHSSPGCETAGYTSTRRGLPC